MYENKVCFVKQKEIFFYIDEVKYNADKTMIRGWAFSTRGEVQVSLKDNISFEVNKTSRPDVISKYGSYENLKIPELSGFEILFYSQGKSCVNLIITDGIDKVEVKQRILLGASNKANNVFNIIRDISRKITLNNLYKFIRIVKNNGMKEAIIRVKRIFFRTVRLPWQEKFLTSRPSLDELKKQREMSFDFEPTISLIVPVYNPKPVFLEAMIDSVISQTYSKWELCLADGSTDEKIWEIISRYVNRDSRIKAVKLEKNLGISGNSNVAVEMATGEYVGLFDHDDLLTEEALYEIVCALNPKEGARPDFIYTDEDKTDETGKFFFDPHFKPDFSPEFLESINYICHFTVISKELIGKAGGAFRSEYDGSQDFDLFLRTTEIANNIVHIPKVLYHWRVHKQSTAGGSNAKGYTHKAGAKALEAHLQRLGRKGKVRDGVHGEVANSYKIDYEIEGKELVSIIIPNYNHKEDLQKCLESIWEKTTYPYYEIIIVENNSTDKEIFNYYKELEAKDKARVLKWPGRFNYAAINNWAEKEAHGKYLLFLNNDIEIITPEWIEGMIMYAQFNEIGAVGAKLYYSDETVQHAGVIVGIGGVAGHSHKGASRSSFGYFTRLGLVQNLSAVTAAMLLVRKDVFDEIGGFDEKFIVAFNDVDLCLRIRDAGYRNVFTPEVEAWHYESKSRGSDEENDGKKKRFRSECEYFYERWGEYPLDPYYNVNLTLDKEDFSLK